MSTTYRLLKHNSGDTFAARLSDGHVTGLAGPLPSSYLDPRYKLLLFIRLPEFEYETFGLDDVFPGEFEFEKP